MNKTEKMQLKRQKKIEKVAKFKIGDLVKWNGEKYWNKDEKRTDKITSIKEAIFGGIEYGTIEINNNNGTKPKIGKAYEEYLTKEKIEC